MKMFLRILMVIVAISFGGETRQIPEVCDSAECEEIGKRIYEFMNEEENHCEDFFKFSCGRFLKDDKYPKDATNTYLLGKTQDLLSQQLKSISDKEPNHDQDLYKLLKNMYGLCKNKDKNNKDSVDSIKNKIEEAGPWPVLNEQWNRDTWKLEEAEIKLKRQGFRYGSLIQVNVVLDRTQPQRYIMQILPGELWMDRGDLQGNNKNYDATRDEMIATVQKLGAPEDRARSQMEDALRFESELAQIMQVPYEDNQGELMTIKELSEKVQWVDWMKLTRGLMPDGVQPTEDESVYVVDINYLTDLEHHVKNHEMVAANVMFWHAIRQLILSEAFPGSSSTKGTVEEKCSISTYQRLPLAFSYFYVKKYLSDESRSEARKIVEHIKKELYDDIQGLEWMDDSTKSEARKKMDTLNLVVGYPDELNDIKKVELAHEGLKMDQNHYALAILEWNKWVSDRSFKMLRKPVAETKYWVSDSIWMTGTYNVYDNTLTIPAGLLQPPYFNLQVPSYVNYAILGRIVGEHMAEGIIDQGTIYDAKGSYRKDGWWSESTRKEFEFTQSCFNQEYKHYKSITGQNLDSGWTVYNNMADQGAVKLAYNAYKKNFPDEKSKLPHVSGVYTTNQLFWLVGAHIWCAKMSETGVKYLEQTQREAPPDLRVNAAYGTMKEFGEDFQCGYEKIYQSQNSEQSEKTGSEPNTQDKEEKKSDSESNGEESLIQNPLIPKTRCHLW